MKAKDYVEKYRGPFREAVFANDEERLNTMAGDIMREFIADTKSVMETRSVKTDAGTVSVIRELNQKWNAMCGLFDKNGIVWLKRDGYLAYMKTQIPGLELSMKKGC